MKNKLTGFFKEVEVRMKIQGGRVTSAQTEKLSGKEFKGFNVNIQITEMKDEGKNLEITFENTTTYDTDYAKMHIKGVLIAEADDKEKKKIMDEWKKTKQLPNEAAEQVLMNINYISSTVGTLLAFAINVSAPVNVPRTRIMNLPGQADKAAG